MTYIVSNTTYDEDEIKAASREEINYLSPIYQNTPLILAISKGYNHIDTEYNDQNLNPANNQKSIINAILGHKNFDSINTKGEILGLTALEIAILRHDDLEIINKLVKKGAEVPQKGRMQDLLSLEWKEAFEVLKVMTGDEGLLIENSDNVSNRFTLPTKEQFEENKKAILERFEVKENTYLDRIVNIYKAMFEPIKELWNAEDGILGKIAAILIAPLIMINAIVMTPYIPLLAISDGFNDEDLNKREPSSNLRSNNVGQDRENLHTKRELNKNCSAKTKLNAPSI